MRPGGLRRTSWSALVGLAAGTALATVTAAPAAADITVSETYARPASGTFQLLGHGWGHGRGMSQYGAQGAATLGKTADTITSTYYPNTQRAVQGNPAMRIKLSTDSRTTTREFIPAAGQTLKDLATGKTVLSYATGVTLWRVTSNSSGLRVAYVKSTGTTTLATTYAGPLQVSGTTFIRIRHSNGSSRDYRNAVRVLRSGTSSLMSIAVMPMESYLYGVVPRESPSSFAAAALQAQAIAARSYSTYKRDHVSSTAKFDICDTTQCQVFLGSAKYTSTGTKESLEATSTTNAVKATAGVIRTYGGKAIFSEFSASNGGWSTDGDLPYLVAKADPWDGVTGSSVHSWSASLPVSSLESYFASRGLGSFRTLTITKRDGNGEWGGRVLEVILRGVDSSGNPTTVTTTGSGIYNARPWTGSGSTGVRSRWFWIVPAYASSLVSRSAAPRLVLPPGYPKGTLTAVFRNTGNAGWPVSGLHLALASPAGGPDPLVGGSTRPGKYVKNLTNPGATTVLPGDQVQFAVPIDATKLAPGTRTTSYRVRIGTAAVFGATASWKLVIEAPRYTAARAAPPSLVDTTFSPPEGSALWADKRTVVVPRNGTTTLRLTAENTGNFSWAVGPTTPIQLGTSGPRGRASDSASSTWLAPNRAARLVAASPVPVGKTGTFDVQLAGNSIPTGLTTESFEPIFYGRSWIGGNLTTLNVIRVEPRVGRAALPELAPATGFNLANAPTGSRWLTIRLRNVGGQAWEVGKEQLGTSSAFALASGWPSSTRTPPLRANVSRPGAAAVAPGEVGEWMVRVSAYKHAAGTYATTLRAVGPSGFYGPSLPVRVKVVNASFTYEYVGKTGTVTVPSTGLAYAWFDIRNTSNFVWPVGGMLRSTVLAGTSPSQATTWLSPSRPGALSSNLTSPGLTYVRAGEVARFRVLLAGNGRTPRTTSERFGMAYDGWRSSPFTVTLAYRVV